MVQSKHKLILASRMHFTFEFFEKYSHLNWESDGLNLLEFFLCMVSNFLSLAWVLTITYLWKDNLWVLLTTILWPMQVYSSRKEVATCNWVSLTTVLTLISFCQFLLPLVMASSYNLTIATGTIAVVSLSNNLTSVCISTKMLLLKIHSN